MRLHLIDAPKGTHLELLNPAGKKRVEQEDHGKIMGFIYGYHGISGKSEVEMGFHKISWELRKVRLAMNLTWIRG